MVTVTAMVVVWRGGGVPLVVVSPHPAVLVLYMGCEQGEEREDESA